MKSINENTKRIIILPDFIANQIAAGEVVQRPESIVKELIENSFDAGASSVAVIIKDAGKKLIHIIDDGAGIHKDDLPLTVKRHATSKILTPSDLEEISTFGFRGEALASIAAVAQVEIRSKRRGEELGWSLLSEPGKPPKIEPASIDSGTQIFVKNLFFNVPARKKFMKSNLTELRHISDTLIRFGLIMPEKRLTFYDNENLIFDLKPQNWQSRAAELLGADAFNKLLPVDYSNEFVKIEGFAGSPELSRQTKSTQYLFLNRRPVQSKSLSHAVYAVYENLLAKNYHPVYILNITIDFDKVDVNVHPQKHEVKFEDERSVYNSVRDAVYKTLNKTFLIPDIDALTAANPFQKSSDGLALINTVTGELYDDFSSSRLKSYGGKFKRNYFEPAPNMPQSAFDLIFSVENEPVDAVIPNLNIQAANQKLKLKDFQIITKDFGIRIIYIQRAVGQIIFENLKARYNKGTVQSQNLIFPYEIEMTPSYLSCLNILDDKLRKSGWDFNIDGNKVLILAAPAVLDDNPEFFKEILDLYSSDENRLTHDETEAMLFNMSMRAAWGKTNNIKRLELDNLEENLMNCESPKLNFIGLKIYEDVQESRLKKLFE